MYVCMYDFSLAFLALASFAHAQTLLSAVPLSIYLSESGEDAKEKAR